MEDPTSRIEEEWAARQREKLIRLYEDRELLYLEYKGHAIDREEYKNFLARLDEKENTIRHSLAAASFDPY